MKDWNKAYKEKKVLQKPVLPIIEEAVDLFKERKFRKILDLGFGTGRHTIYLAQQGFTVFGVDTSQEGLNITEGRLKMEGLKASLSVHDAGSLPYGINFIDAIVSTYVIHHGSKEDINIYFKEIKRVLKRSGLLVLTLLSTKDGFYGQGKETEKNTFLGVPDVDSDVLHHLFTKNEVEGYSG
ncbi:MAG: class I SAM-dependent methyltransferase [Patescibacteria group bacterium]